MQNLVFDSFALIAIFRNEAGCHQVKEYLSWILNHQASGFISSMQIGEIYYMIKRKNGIRYAEIALNAILEMPLEVNVPDLQTCISAALIKSSYNISYADAFAAVLTIDKKATLITGDPEFKNLIKEPGFKVHFLQ
jgi:predicted nucleic acid-binding protein